MKIATLLFTYNRYMHTEQVINSLKQNTILPEKLIIFQDGLKQSGTDENEWKKVNSLIHSVDWCHKEIIVSEYNKGLAKSIVSGIDYAFKENDAIIVLEDDCVAAPDFIRFMKQNFYKYEKDNNIYSISGYAWPIEMKKGQYDVYGCGRVSSWGWGTWKNRWKIYKEDYELIKRMKRDKISSCNLAMWGQDLEKILVGNVNGENDSWAVFWALNVIFKRGICINPYESLIKNIGMDASGVHCGVTNEFDVPVSKKERREFKLPDHPNLSNETAKAFALLYGSYTAISDERKEKEKILVYGLGNFYYQKEKLINELYNIRAFIDRKKKGWYAGKKIIQIDEIELQDYDKIVLMVYNMQECINISKRLINCNVNVNNILLGHDLFGLFDKKLEKISFISDENDVYLRLQVAGKIIRVKSEDEFNNVYEVLVEKIYNYQINNNKKDIIIDVGMNIGDSALYFLNCRNVEKVYGYEPFKDTYLCAKNNLKEYLCDSKRIEIFQYGISFENGIRLIGFNKNMSCGQSSLPDVRNRAYEWYKTMNLVQSENEENEKIEVRAASEVFFPIIQRHTNCNIILKMDCEGEEYGIIAELSQNGVLEKFCFIMLEWHYEGKDRILKYLNQSGFSYWCCDKNEKMGLIYAFR